MTNLTPVSSFDNVPELETNTLALGGPGGPMNLPAQALLNRTQWLKDNAVAGSSSPYAVGTGTANACTAAYTPAITALADGMKLRFLAAATNTGAATFAPDAVTAHPIVGGAYAALQGGEILADGEVELTWNAGLSSWVITAQAGGSPQVPDATQSKHAASKGQVDKITTDLASTAAGKGSSLVAYLAGTVKSFLDSLSATGSSVGSALIGFIQSGTGAVSRTSQDKMRETRISVKDFGAVGDNVADDTAAFNAAVTYCATRKGGTIFVPAGIYKITSMITVTSSNTRFAGEGFDTAHDVGSVTPSSSVQWAGGADDAMFLFTSIAGASNQCLAGCGIVDIGLNGANTVKAHVELRSHRAGKWRFMGFGSAEWVLKLGVVSLLGEAEDTQYNDFEVWGRQSSSPGGGICLTRNGNNPPNANTSFNLFRMVDIQLNSGTGLRFENSDTNIFEMVRFSGVGKAFEFHGSNLNSSDTARGNQVKLLSSPSVMTSKAYGTTTYTFPSVGNFIGLDIGNATQYPTVETGASCFFSALYGVQFQPAFAQMAIASSVPNAVTARSALGSETLRLQTSSSNHMILDNGTTQWSITGIGADLLLKPVSGTGGGVLRFGTATGGSDVPINGYVTIKDANGVTRKLATIA